VGLRKYLPGNNNHASCACALSLLVEYIHIPVEYLQSKETNEESGFGRKAGKGRKLEPPEKEQMGIYGHCG